MLKHRLFFGTMMTAGFGSLAILDGWLDGSLSRSTPDEPIQATLLCIFIAALTLPAQRELARLAAAKNLKIFTPLAVAASIMFATAWYWPQIINLSPRLYLPLLAAFTLAASLLWQHLFYGNRSVLANCGATSFAVCYLGLLASFVLGIRIEFGLWPFLMFVAVIKAADIGAYAIGSLLGKHKFSPTISPGKTWEGFGGAVAFAVVVSFLFSVSCGIMRWPSAVFFGLCFAFLGQMGDLAESMMKRDAEQKDSAGKVPGFGGILDIIDSILVASPFAYLYFRCCA